ncbi:MAG: peptidoglycan-binding protein, partial [Lachnospiraceae bacterium]|nr:peptidoglycan-binding protein [Lachnospiraceae bacterium]
MDNSNLNDTGYLRIFATTEGEVFPIKDARIEISSTGEPNRILEVLTTNESGNSETIPLDAPPLEYSMSPSDNQPYSEYNIKITAPNYEEQIITGVQILSGETGVQNVQMIPSPEGQSIYNPTVISGHTLWEYYPPKIAEAEVKPVNESGEIVLRKVVVPETIVVHDGVPSDPTATNYYVPYLDYIKNVACSEIYSTWPTSTIEANVLAIMSFTLNRVFTEW